MSTGVTSPDGIGRLRYHLRPLEPDEQHPDGFVPIYRMAADLAVAWLRDERHPPGRGGRPTELAIRFHHDTEATAFWIRTVEATIATAAAEIPLSYLVHSFREEFDLDWNEPDLERARRSFGAEVIPELDECWHDRTVERIADLAGASEADWYPRLRDYLVSTTNSTKRVMPEDGQNRPSIDRRSPAIGSPWRRPATLQLAISIGRARQG